MDSRQHLSSYQVKEIKLIGGNVQEMRYRTSSVPNRTFPIAPLEVNTTRPHL